MRHLTMTLTATAFGFFAATSAHAGVITGDEFGLTVSEDGVQLDQQTGVAGVAGPDIESGALSLVEINWLDGDTFELDFFGNGPLTNLVFQLTDLDFVTGMMDEDIVGLNLVSAAFGFDVDLAFTANTITITFPFLDTIMAADGEILVIDVLTAASVSAPEIPLPAGAVLFLTGLGALAARRRIAAS